MRGLERFLDSRLVRRARELDRLTRRLRRLLPPGLAERVAVSHYRDGVLTLNVPGAAWASRLRFMEGEIREDFEQRLGLPVRRVRVRVSIAPPEAERRPGPAHMSAAGRASLEAAAEGVDDERLKASLRRLARHGGK